MRALFNLILLICGLGVFMSSCDKAESLPLYQKGTAPDLGASSVNLTLLAPDSNKVALSLGWSDAQYATDPSHVKYVVELDSAGKKFANANTWTTNSLNYSFLTKELNNVLLNRGYAFNTPVTMEVRVTSSYTNNNEKLSSNVIQIRMVPYKIPPKVALPSSNRLFIVGGATQGGWNNPVPVPVQELTRMDETTWSGIFKLTGNQSYLLLPVNGDWNTKYGGVAPGNNSNNPLGDDFKIQGSDLIAPATTGNYRVTVNFQTGKFSLTPVANDLPSQLYITGDATPDGWTNSPSAAQKFTQLTNGVFEITMAFTPGKFYKFLSSPGNWQPQFGGSSATGGTLGANYGGGNDPDAIPTSAAAGNYKIQVNFLTNSYTVTKL